MEELEYVKIYDMVFDWSNIALDEDFEFKQTVRLEEGLFIDFDVDDRPVCFELNQTSKRLRVYRDQFSDTKSEGVIIITRDTIRFVLEVPSRSRSFESEAPNIWGIRPGSFRYSAGVNTVDYD